MTIKVHPSAHKHGLNNEDILEVSTNPLWIEPLSEDNPGRELRLGFDTRGRLLEVVVLIFDSGNELVIHAMKARKEYVTLLP